MATVNRWLRGHCDRIFFANRMYNQPGSPAEGSLRVFGSIYFFKLPLSKGGVAGKRRDALRARMACLSESIDSELRKMRCLEFVATS